MNMSFIGHSIQRNLLQHQLAGSDVRGAYLVYGPTGLGKNYLVSQLILDTLCSAEDPSNNFSHRLTPTLTPNSQLQTSPKQACLLCPDCHWFDQNSHPDVYRLTADEACTVEVARDINDFARTGAVRRSRRKYIIIERAETMTPEAANSLLKLLEEPPAGVIFFLLAERSQSVLPTIRSRCQLIKLVPLSDSDMRLILQQQLIPVEQHELLLGLSLGRPGKALALARGQLAEYQQIVPELLIWLRGDVNTSWQQLKLWLDQLTKTTDSADAKRSLMLARLNYLELLLRDCVFFHIHSEDIVNQAQLPQLQALSQRYSLGQLITLFKHISVLRSQLTKASTNTQLSWENFLLTIKQLSQTPSL